MIRVGSIIQAGYKQVPSRKRGVGLIHRRLENIFHDRREWPLMALEPWNADAKTLAEKTVELECDLVIHIGFSYGVGQGQFHYAHELDRIGGPAIDLGVSIDGVTRHAILKWRSLRHGGRYAVPANVRNLANFRTLYQPERFRPVGHEMVVSPSTRILRDVVYGTSECFARRGAVPPPAECIEQTRDQAYTHVTIDDAFQVHDAVVELVEAFVRERTG